MWVVLFAHVFFGTLAAGSVFDDLVSTLSGSRPKAPSAKPSAVPASTTPPPVPTTEPAVVPAARSTSATTTRQQPPNTQGSRAAATTAATTAAAPVDLFDCGTGPPVGGTRWPLDKSDWCCEHKGVACVDEAPQPIDDPRTCKGSEKQSRDCEDIPECSPCRPVDCRFSEWADWREGDACTGICTRHRILAVTNNECGTPCSGAKVETKRCEWLSCTRTPRDCVLGDWSSWSSCGGDALAQKSRKRGVLVPLEHGGKECDGTLNETVPCASLPSTDCLLSDWGEWTACSATCEGWHSQMRRVLQRARLGGRPCEGALRRALPCNAEPCSVESPCVMAAWGDWNGCTLLTGMNQKYRTREVQRPARRGGEPCNEAVRETLGCPVASDAKKPCEISAWSSWAACDKACDGGQRFRRRQLTQEPAGGGTCEERILDETAPCNTEPCPRPDDCELGDWGQWSSCSAECGVGAARRSREVLRPPRVGGQGCVAPLGEVRACYGIHGDCNSDDCIWDGWSEWGACSVLCGGGTTRRDRAVKQVPRLGGKPCPPEDKSEVAPCNTHSCDVCIDGAWNEWEEWSDCSVTCSSGFRSRQRDVGKHPNDCGKPAVGLQTEYEVCTHSESCIHDRDCALSAWSKWSPCSDKCFGVAERHRRIETHATGKGRTCFAEAVKEIAPCNPGPDEKVPEGCGKADPKPCVMADWSDWDQCSATCGGQKVRTRHLLTPSHNDGAPCDDIISEVAPCGAPSCLETCVDCEYGMWSDWGACSKCGGQRYRHRSVTTLPNHCGKLCDITNAQETSTCRSDCSEARFCAWSDWSTSSPCSADCGPATLLQERSMAIFEGKPDEYIFEGTLPMSCSGTQLQLSACERPSCDEKMSPVDCAFGDWGDWSEPMCTQLCERHRVIARMNKNGGTPCDGRLTETRHCEHSCASPEDCKLAAWDSWGQCTTHESQRFRSRSVLQYAANEGQMCQGSLQETAGCNVEFAPMSPCNFDLWSDWSQCTKSCGSGLKTRARKIREPAMHGGTMCEGRLEELSMCNTFGCGDTDTPCLIGDWSGWTSCEGASYKYRNRDVLQGSFGGSAPCNSSLREVLPCMEEVVDCEVSAWTAWDECDKSCGIGQRFRHRQVITNVRNGGMPCPEHLVETVGCIMAPCNMVDCTVSDWMEWDDCSSTCGSGQQSRSRQVAQKSNDGGEGCSLALNETRECVAADPCPTIDCRWSDWSDWSSCSSECDGGQRSRDRHIAVSPAKGGRPCEAVSKEETQPCNMQKCSDERCVDGRWDDWEDWEPCSKTCDGGLTWRSRRLLSEASQCGKPATGPSKSYASCNVGVACEESIDCKFSGWEAWGSCSKDCDGTKKRSRGISIHARGRGAHCGGSLQETGPCNPVDSTLGCLRLLSPEECVLGDWGSWGGCSASCGGGQRSRSREVLIEARNGGDCPAAALSETGGCGLALCPRSCEPVGCQWGTWSEWSACDKCGGERGRFRHVLKHPQCGGQPCDAATSEEVSNCTRRCHEGSYCAFSDWTVWSRCSATCGNGMQERERHLRLAPAPEMRFLNDGLDLGGGSLEDKFEALHLETQALETRRFQELIVAFVCGLLSLVAGVVGSRRCCGHGRQCARPDPRQAQYVGLE